MCGGFVPPVRKNKCSHLYSELTHSMTQAGTGQTDVEDTTTCVGCSAPFMFHEKIEMESGNGSGQRSTSNQGATGSASYVSRAFTHNGTILISLISRRTANAQIARPSNGEVNGPTIEPYWNAERPVGASENPPNTTNGRRLESGRNSSIKLALVKAAHNVPTSRRTQTMLSRAQKGSNPFINSLIGSSKGKGLVSKSHPSVNTFTETFNLLLFPFKASPLLSLRVLILNVKQTAYDPEVLLFP